MRRDRTVIDDASALWLLPAHQSEGTTGAEENAVEVGVDHVAPLLECQFIERHGRGVDPGIVEHHVEASVYLGDGCKQCIDTGRVTHISGDRQRFVSFAECQFDQGLQRLRPTSGQYQGESVGHQSQGHGAADSATGAGDQGHL
ncbi:hypothetical protein D9M73_198550 [compost metagenome]